MLNTQNFIRLLILIVKLTRKFNVQPLYLLFFSYYFLIKLDKLLKMQLKLQCIPDEIFSVLIVKHGKCSKSLVDQNLYILCNCNVDDKAKQWFYICCKHSKRKYKVAVIFTKDITENVIYVSESMRTNVRRHFMLEHLEDLSYILLPASSESMDYINEVKISLISNPHDCADNILSNLLQKHFSVPKYLRPKDIFKIDVKKLAPEIKYCTADSKLQELYFTVTEIKIENSESNMDGGFLFYETSTLFQESNVNSYIPCKCLCDTFPFDTEEYFKSSWPPVLRDTILEVQSSINPFLQKDINIELRPIFLIEGPAGSGKSRLIKTVAETLGLHLVEADFTEIQSLSSAQTEAKLRIILNEAEMFVPCILMLKNIQVFGLNSEGQKDERVLSVFTFEMKKLYMKKRNFPIIIIATSNETDIQIDTERNFIEKINICHLNEEQRYEFLSWFIKNRGLKHQVDLHKIAKMCSDFVLADLEGLVLHAVKSRFKLLNPSDKNSVIELSNDDFDYAYEYMQSMFSDQIGAPRVPKVYWEDIGGLADLKREIMRRIEMPLLNIPGMGRSGLLLYGPPGTGKTLLAKAVATECQLHFLSVKGPELLNMYVGQSEKNVRQVFERARAASPCIIFFDELDSLAPNRGKSGDSGGVMDRMVSQLLAEMDGLESAGRVFIIGATNRPDLIDPALLRPGRFDKMLYVGIYADPESQLAVLKAVTRHFTMEKEGRELDELLEQLPENLTGADLQSVCSNAWFAAVRRVMNDPQTDKDKVRSEDVVVKLDDFVQACRDLVPSVSKEDLLKYEKLKKELSNR